MDSAREAGGAGYGNLFGGEENYADQEEKYSSHETATPTTASTATGSQTEWSQAATELLLTRRLFGAQTPESGGGGGGGGDSGGHLLLLFALLVLINLTVILGNILVILAVYATAKLRNVTNIFIVSLATADLLLGVLVLPYALMFEVSRVQLPGRLAN